MIAFRTRLCIGAALVMAAPAYAAEEATAPAAPTPAAISFGQSVSGELAVPAESCAVEAPNVRSYSFAAEADTRIEITMHADDFDTVVELGKMVDCQFVSMGRNDDGTGDEDGLNSRLTGRLPEAGTYVIRATSFGDAAAGKFTLTLNRLPALRPAPAPIALRIGRRVTGTLSAGDAIIEQDANAYDEVYLAVEAAAAAMDGDAESATVPQLISDSGRPYHLYSLAGRAGQELRISLDSDEFDSFLEVGVDSPLGFAVVESNDDGEGADVGLNSRLTIKLERAGTLTIRVSPLSAATGDYSLLVQPEAEAAAADAAAAAAEAAAAAAEAAAEAAAPVDATQPDPAEGASEPAPEDTPATAGTPSGAAAGAADAATDAAAATTTPK